jgi:anti-anti-sigma regulatory factor
LTTTVRYEADTHRLRIGGECLDDDRAVVQDALDTFARLASSHLIVDLTAVTRIDQSAANHLVASARRLRRDGGTVVFLRKHGTSVDRVLSAAEFVARQT